MSSAPGNTSPVSGPPAEGRRHRGALLAWALLIAYASLYPFLPVRLPGAEAPELFLRARFVSEYDVIMNVVAYAPIGALAFLQFAPGRAHGSARWRAVLLGAALSLVMEACQFFVATRVASLLDVLANTAGAFAGTLLFFRPVERVAMVPLSGLRDRFFIEGGAGDTGLVLVILWLLAQLNPALPFFEAGNTVDETGPLLADFIVTTVSVALTVAAFGLFVSVLLKAERGALGLTLVLLTVALWCKFAMASVMLKPNLAAMWMSEGRMAGLVAGLLLFLPLRRLRRAARTYLAAVCLLAGSLFAKIFGEYSELADFLRLFHWPHGQLASFATLTRWLHEAWPVLALGWLIVRFVRHAREPIQ
jgi:VanZ family protein